MKVTTKKINVILYNRKASKVITTKNVVKIGIYKTM